MDYAAVLKKAQEFIRMGHAVEAIRILGRALELLYGDLHSQVRGMLPRSKLEKVVEIEARIVGSEQVREFALGDEPSRKL